MRYRLAFLYLLLGFFTVLFSCKKIDTTLVGVDLLPAVDNITTFDTLFTVVTNNELLNDSASVLRTEDHALGLISADPDFGQTTAEIYVQLTPLNFGAHPFVSPVNPIQFDSVVLALSFSKFYGDSNSIEKFDVYEISPNAAFTHNFEGYPVDATPFEVNPTLLGSKVVDFRSLDDSVIDVRKRDTTRLKNQLRIRLSNSLGSRFQSYDTASVYKTDSAFRTYFKGFAIKVDPAGSPAPKGLAYFNLSQANTKLIFYYRSLSSGTVTDTLAQEFIFSPINYCNANSIKRTPGGDFQTYLNNGIDADERIYLHASPGSMATVRIPGLRQFTNRIIHRAELIFDILNNIPEPTYASPKLLFLDANDTANKRILTIPYDFSYQDNFLEIVGGSPRGNRYAFNITRYVQGVITRGDPDYSLRLTAPYRTNAGELRGGVVITPAPPGAKLGYSINTPIAAGRVVLTGGNYPDASRKARLRIIYSKI